MESAKKFRVLKHNQILMNWMGIYPSSLTETKIEFFKTPIVYEFLFCAIVCDVCSSAVFIYNDSSPLGANLDPFFILISGIQCGGMYLNLGLKLEKVQSLHLKLQEIVDQGDLVKNKKVEALWIYSFFELIPSFWSAIYINRLKS